ncbi:wall associated kinase-like protein, partial [Trifolium medium]|nr:wall associated kinase-like protein [Trifolium medium]
PLYDLYYQPYDYADNASQSAFTDCTNVQLPIKDFANGDDPFAFATANIPIQVKRNVHIVTTTKEGGANLTATEVTVSKKKGLSWNVKLGIVESQNLVELP